MLFWNRTKIPQISADELLNQLEEDDTQQIILDIRRPDEWEKTGTIPGAVTVSKNKLDEKIAAGLDLNHGKPVVVVCHSGTRSKRVTKKLRKKYDINAINLKGGLKAWYYNGGRVNPIN